ncbi:hypothetical protein LLB_2695 [Legionella longbeachae D-4968]|nr:hypothetical protein LLB_2695 [Legionella longbeachae D-4968]
MKIGFLMSKPINYIDNLYLVVHDHHLLYLLNEWRFLSGKY